MNTTSETLITDEIKGKIGMVGEPFVVQVERGMIARLATAVGDPNPRWCDREHAITCGQADIVSPPYLLLTPLLTSSRKGLPQIANPSLKRWLDAGGKWEFYRAIRPGDTIVAIPKFADAYEKEGKAGKMLFLVTEVTLKNQFNEVVGKSQTTLIQF